MSRYQLVFQGEEVDERFVVDNPGDDGFSYHRQPLGDGALIEVPGGARYVVVDLYEENGLARFICEPF